MNNRRILTVLLAFCAVLIVPLCALAVPETKQAAPLGIHLETMNPEGEYVVYVLKEGEWKEAGKLSFDRYFRQKEMDLSQYVSEDEDVKVRLVQKGGGAAHIDAVVLGGRPPVEVKGVEDALALKKLSQRDFDVLDAFEKSIELTFPASGSTKVISLTARVEETRIGGTPFQFPLSNFSKRMTENSEFYRYSLSVGIGPDKKGRLDMLEDPFFKEYSATATGHPSGYTYGWVRNDDKNLYVTIDFTPDDTEDGDKDYSKVYVKTEKGVKEFKVSVPETKWGTPDFTYTDKVAYQHKVYAFTIPLNEIGIKEVKKEKELLLAFETYGTAGSFSVSKNANGSYNDTFSWTITKDVDKTIVNQSGGSATFNYSANVSHGDSEVSNVKVTGTIQVSIPFFSCAGSPTSPSPLIPIVPIQITSVTDQLSNGTTCTVTNGGSQTLTSLTTKFNYECDLSNLPSGTVTNTATVSWPQQTPCGQSLPAGSVSSLPVSVSFTENEIDECVTVSDSLQGSLGTVCVSDPNPKTFTYSQTFPVPSAGCATHDNTATFTTNDTGTTGSASQSVKVCNNSAICRTSGFWGTHAGIECPKKQPNCGSQNITQDVITAAQGCLAVCGKELINTNLDDASSAVEALCVSPKGDAELQLVNQLTTATLNCVMSQSTATISCSNRDCTTCGSLSIPGQTIDIGTLVTACNDACISDAVTAIVTPVGGNQVMINCIDALNCFNNGGIFNAGTGPSTATCQTGTCSIDNSPCGIKGLPSCPKVMVNTRLKSQTCVPLPDNCESEPLCQVATPGNSTPGTPDQLCFDALNADVACPQTPAPAPAICTSTPGPAGSSNACNSAIGNQCTVIEGGCKADNGGTCPVCPTGQTDCTGVCTNLETDPDNCGSCANACSSGQSCVSGSCTCPAGETLCSSTCVNTSTDPNNCGSCANACSSGQSCVSGSCTCPAGQTLCNGTCVNTSTDPNNCGSCANACSGAIGTCCSGVCVDTQTDTKNCGSCEFSCPGGVHAACCDSVCVNTQTDNSNCNGCENVCPGTEKCCNSACVDTSSDKFNCGSCGNVCTGSCCSSNCCPGACSGSGCS